MSTQLRKSSFRSRLRLFFVFIVVVPMIAMAVVLFLLIGESQRRQTDSMLFQAQLAVEQLDGDLQAEAGQVAETIERDQRLANARASGKRAIQDRLSTLAEETGAAYVHLNLSTLGDFRAGSPPAMAPDSRRLVAGGEETGRLTVAMLSADQYVERVSDYTDAEVAVLSKGGEKLATTSPNAPAALPNESASGSTGPSTESARSTPTRSADRSRWRCSRRTVAAHARRTKPEIRYSQPSLLVLIVLAFACAVALAAAPVLRSSGCWRRRGLVPATSRWPSPPRTTTTSASWVRSSTRWLASSRRGWRTSSVSAGGFRRPSGVSARSVAAGLDRRGLLEIVVQTAVDGTGASAGRAHARA